jgi:hypothetical protein
MTQAAQVSANNHGAKFSILYQFYTSEHFCRARPELQHLSLSLSTSLSFSGEEAAKPWMASSRDNLLLSKTQDRLKTHTLSLFLSLDVQP